MAYRYNGESFGKEQVMHFIVHVFFCRDWLCSLDRQPFLLPLTVYTLLRLIPDHHRTNSQSINSGSESISLQNLRDKELALVDELLRKNVCFILKLFIIFDNF